MIGTRWSYGCAEMYRTTFQDGEVNGLIAGGFVPVQVDADERPDINNRYHLGGWPTIAFLTPDGRLLGGQRFTGPRSMADLLHRVARAFDARAAELMTPVPGEPHAQADAEASPGDIENWVADHLQQTFDASHGGFGRNGKHVQADPILLAVERLRTGDRSMTPVVRVTLDAICWSPIFDDAAGGVFRCAARRDWSEPSPEKLLEVNAAALGILLAGAVALDDPGYRERATDIVRYVRSTLADVESCVFFAGEHSAVDRAVYTSGNAEMVGAFLRAGAVLEDDSLLKFAVSVLDHVTGEAYGRGSGLRRRIDGGESVRGLLVDHVVLAEALLDAAEVTDRDVYVDLAQEAMLFALRRLWNASAGTFGDRLVATDDVGLLRQPLTPFRLNCRAAGVLARLALLTGKDELAARARQVLAALERSARSRGLEAASYVLACRALERGDSAGRPAIQTDTGKGLAESQIAEATPAAG